MRFHSPITDIDIPNMDIPTFIFEHSIKNNIFGKNPNQIVLTDENTSLSFEDVKRLSNKFASGLVNRVGFKRGDIVAVVLPNSVMYPVVTLGIQMAGGVCATINPEFNSRELAYHLVLVRAKSIIAEEEKIPEIKEALKLSDINIDTGQILTINNIDNLYSEKPFTRVNLTNEQEASETIAFIVFSSGTTGMPKGVQVSHRNLIASVLQTSAHMNSDTALMTKFNAHGKTIICALPMFHMLALSCMLHFGIHNGFHIVVMRRFDLERFCAISQKYNASFARIVPPIALGIANHPIVNKYDLSGFATLASSAAPLSRDIQMKVERQVGISIIQESGMSEASGLTNISISDDVHYGSCGRLVPNIEAKVINEAGQELGANERGELCFRGPAIMRAYLDNPQATREAVDDEGFLRSGDIGYFDSNGNCFITGRKKDLIKYKGFQVSPSELEAIIARHPAVVDCAVIPVYDESCASEVPKAFVDVRKEFKSQGLADEIKMWVDELVVGYKRLRGGVEISDDIPKSASGKVLRRVLREREEMKRHMN